MVPRRPDGAPAAHPWVALHDATFVSLPAGETHRVPLPDDGARRLGCHGSVGRWLLFQDKIDGACSLVDPISRAAAVRLPRLPSFAPLGAHTTRSFFKLALPSSRRVSPDSLFAVLITIGD